jgi:hypothetical protein
LADALIATTVPLSDAAFFAESNLFTGQWFEVPLLDLYKPWQEEELPDCWANRAAQVSARVHSFPTGWTRVLP